MSVIEVADIDLQEVKKSSQVKKGDFMQVPEQIEDQKLQDRFSDINQAYKDQKSLTNT